jgi:hypothetical protein
LLVGDFWFLFFKGPVVPGHGFGDEGVVGHYGMILAGRC